MSSTPALNFTIEGLRAQIIANATMIFPVVATLFHKEAGGKLSSIMNKKEVMFEVIVGLEVIPSTDPNLRSPTKAMFKASIQAGDMFDRRTVAIGKASDSMSGALYSLLWLTMAELGLRERKDMLQGTAREHGVIDKKFT